MTTGIYTQLYDLLHQYIFGLGVELSNYQDLVLIFLSTCGSLFVAFLPFLLVWRVLKLFC